jgi:hypothetical protein
VCKQETFDFQDLGRRKVQAAFDGGYLSADGGAVLLREVESKHRVISKIAACFKDSRDPRYREHPLESLIAQRVNALALGYEDLNDHDSLRLDPVHALAAGREDLLGSRRARNQDCGKSLAGRSTLNRLELGAESSQGRYRKIAPDLPSLEKLLVEEGAKAIPKRSKRIVLDFDATDDPLHGSQQGAYFNGYYKSYCYLPLYCFCGNVPLWAQLRDCKRDASDGTVEALEKIVPKLRERFGEKVEIVVRGDSAFAREAIMAWCEGEGVLYCFGLARNKSISPLLEQAFLELEAGGGEGQPQLPIRKFVEFGYRTQKSWSRFRRVVGKAELLEKGRNPRFVVTNLPPENYAPRALYEDFYCARGEMENRIKEQQLDLFADRTSTGWKSSNQLRLWLSAFAHLILSRLRAEVLKGTRWAKATVGQIRLKLLKISARVVVSTRRVRLEFASSYSWIDDFRRVHRALGESTA